MVSTLDHCLVDLLYRRKVGELGADIAIVIGNHEVGRAETEAHGLPFVHLPVTAKTKPVAERRLLALLDEHQVDILVLARYMQILSDEFCRAMDGRVINIHHSFLPSFKGAQPYAQAHARGVKLIGATAHFVTPDLDDGPIIDQAVHRVTHADTPADFAVIGRDVERQVLARAVRLVTEDRVLIAGGRTVTFA